MFDWSHLGTIKRIGSTCKRSRLSAKVLQYLFSVRFAMSQIVLTMVGTQFYLTLPYAKSHALQSTVSDMSRIALTMIHNYMSLKVRGQRDQVRANIFFRTTQKRPDLIRTTGNKSKVMT